jgi:hypothetical protein
MSEVYESSAVIDKESSIVAYGQTPTSAKKSKGEEEALGAGVFNLCCIVEKQVVAQHVILRLQGGKRLPCSRSGTNCQVHQVDLRTSWLPFVWELQIS